MRTYRTAAEELPASRPRVMVLVATSLLCLGLLLGMVHEAKADYQYGREASIGGTLPSDSNRYVVEYFGGPNVGSCYNTIVGYDDYYYDYGAWYGPVVHYITYDSCEMRRYGATSAGWSRLKTHERAHSRGWGHYEAPAYRNAAYYPNVNLY